MECNEAPVSVIDVYDIASEIGKEFEKIIDVHGAEAVTSLMPKVINALELLENLATKNERENTVLQELKSRILKLESDKAEKAEDRQRFEKEMEQIEEHWREESRDLVAMVTRLQNENRKLTSSLANKKDCFDQSSQLLSPEVDISVVQRLRMLVDQLRDQLRAKEREISCKKSDIENLTAQAERESAVTKELRRKAKVSQSQVRGLIDEHAYIFTQLQDQQQEIVTLRKRLGIVQKENEDLTKSHGGHPETSTSKEAYDLDDPNRPRFSTLDLKGILHERNELKARVSDLEDELELFRPKRTQSTEEEDDAPVQGPLPYEPDDAPWKKSDSGIRRFFRKLFSEKNVTFIASSPKRSLSSLSKMALAGGSTLDSPL